MNIKIQTLGERIHNSLVDYTKRTDLFTSDLSGLCAVGSYLLASEAKRKYRLNVEFKAVHGHAWTEYKGIIYDVTATQFGHKGKVFSAPRTSLSFVNNEKLIRYYELIASPDDVRELTYINERWPRNQQPKNYKIKWLNQYKAHIAYEND